MWERQGPATILGGAGGPGTREYRLPRVPDMQPGPTRGSRGKTASEAASRVLVIGSEEPTDQRPPAEPLVPGL